MSVLLDTCTFLWLIADPGKLSKSAAQILAAPTTRMFLSVVSAWEIALKFSIGQLSLQQPPQVLVPSQRILHHVADLELTEAAALYLPNLPRLHKDPFDRMLVCQAILHDLVLVTPDPLIRQYPVKTSW